MKTIKDYNNLESVRDEQLQFVKDNYRVVLEKIIQNIGFENYFDIEGFDTKEIADMVALKLAMQMDSMLQKHEEEVIKIGEQNRQ